VAAFGGKVLKNFFIEWEDIFLSEKILRETRISRSLQRKRLLRDKLSVVFKVRSF
jgi:hypothetical protein